MVRRTLAATLALALSPWLVASGARAQDGGAGAGREESSASDAPEASEEAPAAPTQVYVGLYPQRIADLDLRTGTAAVTYYLWTRWSGDVDGTALELVNGTVESREHEYRSDEDGVRYAYYRCRATVHLDLDFRAFPLDQHAVRLDFEHADEAVELVVLAVDHGGVRHVRSPAVSGWDVADPRYEILPSEYHTNWGVPGADPDEVTRYSRFRVTMALTHAPGATFAKTFLTLFIAVLIAFLGFFIHPVEIEARVGVGVAGIFGAVTSQEVVAANLPEISYLTLSDSIHIAGLVFIFVAMLVSAVSAALVRRDRVADALRLDARSRAIAGPAFVLAVIALLLVY